jgi:hypothetical protein
MKKLFFLLSMMVLLFSSCITLEEMPTGTPVPVQETATAQEQPSSTLQLNASATIDPATTNTATATFTATTTGTVIPSATATIPSTFTPTLTATKTLTLTPSFTPTKTATPTSTPTPTPYPYILQNGAPVYLANFGYPDAGCNWMGIGGQVFGSGGNPLINIVVWVRGVIQGQQYEKVVLTGTAEGYKYGPGGFEAILSSTAADTSGIFSIQLLDLNGNVLSDRVYFDTSAECNENLIILNFSAH